jgi:2',3'-cyclic-nucleotide 2'-phosphodiesterase (5'-nucleotidase family)
LTVADGHVTKHYGRLLPLWVRPGGAASRLTALIDSMEAEIEKEYSEVIGTLRLDWFRKDPARGMATFITEAQRTAALADVAFMNADGIRKDLVAGPITRKDLFEVLPFQNVLTTFQLSGNELLSALRFHCQQSTRILITGMGAAYEKKADGSVQIESIEIGGKPLDDGRMYSCVASDYFVGEAKRYIGIEIVQRITTDQTVFKAVEAAVRQEGVITKNIPYRIRQVNQGESR